METVNMTITRNSVGSFMSILWKKGARPLLQMP
jgi:hypothetical protein